MTTFLKSRARSESASSDPILDEFGDHVAKRQRKDEIPDSKDMDFHATMKGIGSSGIVPMKSQQEYPNGMGRSNDFDGPTELKCMTVKKTFAGAPTYSVNVVNSANPGTPENPNYHAIASPVTEADIFCAIEPGVGNKKGYGLEDKFVYEYHFTANKKPFTLESVQNTFGMKEVERKAEFVQFIKTWVTRILTHAYNDENVAVKQTNAADSRAEDKGTTGLEEFIAGANNSYLKDRVDKDTNKPSVIEVGTDESGKPITEKKKAIKVTRRGMYEKEGTPTEFHTWVPTRDGFERKIFKWLRPTSAVKFQFSFKLYTVSASNYGVTLNLGKHLIVIKEPDMKKETSEKPTGLFCE